MHEGLAVAISKILIMHQKQTLNGPKLLHAT